MIDAGEIVEVLLDSPHVQAVERARAPLLTEHRTNLRSRERRAEREGMGDKVAVAPLRDLDETHVECACGLVLQAVVLQLCPLLENDLAHRIGQIRWLAKPKVGLHHRGPSAFPGDDQNPRTGHLARRGGDENELYRVVQHRSLWKLEQR